MHFVWKAWNLGVWAVNVEKWMPLHSGTQLGCADGHLRTECRLCSNGSIPGTIISYRLWITYKL